MQVIGAVLQYGYENVKNAVVTRQYEYPQGLFFGGKSLQLGLSRLLLFLDKTLSHRERIVHVDLHSGLGKFGEISLLFEGESNPEQVAQAQCAFGSRLKSRYNDRIAKVATLSVVALPALWLNAFGVSATTGLRASLALIICFVFWLRYATRIDCITMHKETCLPPLSSDY